jgi:serine/threonine-protein kinase
MTRCPTCGTTYSDDARFCTRDGTQLVAAWERGGARNAAPTLVGKTLAGKYVVQKKIGEGGMSFVYLATDGTPTGRVAIKVLSSALSHDENAMARLRREAGFGMRLAHPNVCHIIHVGETEDGLVFVVMPFVEGEVLADRTARLGRIPLDDAAGIVRDIAAGLTAAHALEIVHRDLKPENVIVRTLANGSLQAVVMDFGLAKERIAGQDLQKLTATGIILGTPEFMSPEQLRGKPLDVRSDVYALALLAYEMLAGVLPFEGRTQQELMIARLRKDPMPIRERRPRLDVSEEIERVLAKGLARERDQRYATANEFADAFVAAAASPSPSPGTDGRIVGKLFGH